MIQENHNNTKENTLHLHVAIQWASIVVHAIAAAIIVDYNDDSNENNKNNNNKNHNNHGSHNMIFVCMNLK